MNRKAGFQTVSVTMRIMAIVLLAIISATLSKILVNQRYIKVIPSSTLEPFPRATETLPTTLATSQLEKQISPFTSLNVRTQLAWFTNIPRSEDLATVAKNYDFFILIQGNEAKRDLMVNLGAKGPFLQYLEFEAIQDPGSCMNEPKINQVTDQPGDFCNISNNHPDWFLLDTAGQRIVVTDNGNTWYLMDPGNFDWRNFYLKRVKETQADSKWNGVYLDNVPLSLAFREYDGQIPAAYLDDATYQAAIQGFLEYLYKEYFHPNGKLLVANIISRRADADWLKYLTYLDGALFEGWAIDWPDGYRSAETWEKHLLLAEQTQDIGKSIILVSQGNKDDLALQEFAFASYLLINRGRAYFRYAQSDHYRDVWLYDNYLNNLGEPIGSRYKEGDSWHRDFQNGSIVVNPETHKVEILLK